MTWDFDEPLPEPVARARALAPIIEAAAEETERERKVAASVMKALHERRMFRLLLPRSLDGEELAPVTFVRVVEEIARADASTAWCLSQNSGCSMMAGYVPPEAAREIWGPPDAVLAWGAQGGDGYAQVTDGGYRVTGTWSFASGSRRATWLGAHCPIVERDGTRRMGKSGGPEVRTMLFPVSQVVMKDIWHVIGLRGTGSDAYTVTDLFVPETHAGIRDEPEHRRHTSPLYCYPTSSLYASSFAGLALGIARPVLDAFIALATDKSPRGSKGALRENAVIQSQVAQAEAQWRSARAFLYGSVSDVWRSIQATGAELTLEQRMLIRLASTWAIHQARGVVDTVYAAAGSTAIFQSQPFERRFRDMHAVTQQVQGRAAHFETVGQFVLGLDADSPFV
ncbi:MAG TPA: acyl-CoA dehydrogenase family protein [Terriglobales bacterium]|nr:acyl-CoA dehydrogenase family protein [Terriglobales bacterium]